MTAPLPVYRRRVDQRAVIAVSVAVLGYPFLYVGWHSAQVLDQLISDARTTETIVVTASPWASPPTTSMTTTPGAGERLRVVSPVRSSAVKASKPRTTPPAAPTTTRAPAPTTTPPPPTSSASPSPTPCVQPPAPVSTSATPTASPTSTETCP